LIAIVFGEPGGASLLPAIDEVALLAPTLIELEFYNVCLTKLRKGTASWAQVVRADRLRDYFDISLCPVDAPACFALAQKTGLTAYDASYLWLAKTQAIPLITLDRKLSAASRP